MRVRPELLIAGIGAGIATYALAVIAQELEHYPTLFGSPFDPNQYHYTPAALITAPDGVPPALPHPAGLQGFHALINAGQADAQNEINGASGVDRLCFNSVSEEINRLQDDLDARYRFYETHGGVFTDEAHSDIDLRERIITGKLQYLHALARGVPGVSCA